MSTQPLRATPAEPPPIAPDALRCLRLVLDGRTYRQAAETLGLPPPTVARHLRDALRALRPELSGTRRGTRSRRR